MGDIGCTEGRGSGRPGPGYDRQGNGACLGDVRGLSAKHQKASADR
jgi:hypothetical protein